MGQGMLLVIALVCSARGVSSDAVAQALCPSAEVYQQGQVVPAAPPAPEQTQSAGKPPKSVFYSVAVGAGFSHNYTNGEFFRFAAWKPYKQGLTLDVGEQHGGDESSVAFGASYWVSLDPRTTLTVSGGGGTSPFAPRYGVGASISRPFFTVGFTGGISYREWWGGSTLTEVGLGAVRWFPHVILGGGATYSRGEPTNFTGWRGGVGVTYYVWRKTYASIGADFGQGNNRDWNYITRSQGINYGFSQWFNGNSAISIAVGQSLSSDMYGMTISWSREW